MSGLILVTFPKDWAFSDDSPVGLIKCEAASPILTAPTRGVGLVEERCRVVELGPPAGDLHREPGRVASTSFSAEHRQLPCHWTTTLIEWTRLPEGERRPTCAKAAQVAASGSEDRCNGAIRAPLGSKYSPTSMMLSALVVARPA